MPSIRSCIATIAIVALACGQALAMPASQADVSHLSGRDASPALPVLRRDNLSAARVLAAKRRAVQKAKRRADSIASPVLAERATTKTKTKAQAAKAAAKAAASSGTFTGDAIAAFSVYTDTRCGNDNMCKNAQITDSLPATSGSYVCNMQTRTCTISCDAGFLGPTKAGKCRKSTASCPSPPANGIYVGQSPNCKLRCDSALGYTATTVNGAAACVNNSTDANSCGTSKLVCPTGYGGTGTPVCYSGTCGIRCTGNQVKQTTASGKTYCA